LNEKLETKILELAVFYPFCSVYLANCKR